jgi:hypothetical protein
MLAPSDTRVGVLVPSAGVQKDAAVALLHSNAASERYGHVPSTLPTAAIPISFDLATKTRVDFTKATKHPGVLNELTVGPLPESFGVSYGP